MLRTIPLLLLSLAATLVAGCATRNERVRVRRDPGEIEREEEAKRGLSPEEIDERFLLLEEQRRLTPELRASNVQRELTRTAVRGVLGRVPRDPWRTAEADRRRVLFREWADIGQPLPKAEDEPAQDEGEGEAAPPEGEGATKDEGGEVPADGDAPAEDEE